MAKYLYRKCLASKWLEPTEGEAGNTSDSAANLGVVIRKADGTYVSEPGSVNPEVVQAVERLGLVVAITMSSEITASLLQSLTPLQTEISLDDDPHGFALPVVPSVRDLGSARCSNITKEAYMVCCRAEKFVLIWSDFAQGILAHGADVETRLLSIVSIQFHSIYPLSCRQSHNSNSHNNDCKGGKEVYISNRTWTNEKVTSSGGLTSKPQHQDSSATPSATLASRNQQPVDWSTIEHRIRLISLPDLVRILHSIIMS